MYLYVSCDFPLNWNKYDVSSEKRVYLMLTITSIELEEVFAEMLVSNKKTLPLNCLN